MGGYNQTEYIVYNVISCFFPILTTECDPNVLGSNPSSQQSAGSVSVINGEIAYDGVAPGSIAHLVCSKGYSATEETRDRICLCNGIWSGKTQFCEEVGEFFIKASTPYDDVIVVGVTTWYGE